MATTVKMKIKSARMTTDMTGGIADCLDSLLIACDDRAARVKALADLNATHLRLCEWEDERAEKAEVKNG